MTGDANTFITPLVQAVYTGPQSDAIEADPHADISKVKFHWLLPYVTIREVITGTLTLEATGYDAVAKRIYNVHAHGLAFVPMVIGVALNLRAIDTDTWSYPPLVTGQVPISGTVMIGSTDLSGYGGWYKSKDIQVGANATHVTITDVQPDLFQPPDYVPLTSFTYDLDYRIAITNYALPVVP